MIPHHVNPPPGQRATAPYNFVPLPQQVLEVGGGLDVGGEKIKLWKCHDQWVPSARSGWIDLDIEALTPVFIRGAARRRNGAWDEPDDTHRRSAPFLDRHDRPTLPGSSLRGMVRNLVEILTSSKIQPVTDKSPFFRSMTPGRISDIYRSRFIRDLGPLSSGIDIATGTPVAHAARGVETRARAGILRLDGSKRTIVECAFARVERYKLEAAFGTPALTPRRKTQVPDWGVQHHAVHVQVDGSPVNYFFERQVTDSGGERHPDLYLRFRRVAQIAISPAAGFSEGIVVITGDMQSKHLEFVFLTSQSLGATEVPDFIWERFHDDDQVTQWQEMAFERGRPSGSQRLRDGHLRDGEPVFFLCDSKAMTRENPNGLRFVGRAQMFRFPYDLSPADLVPAVLKTAGLDVAEAMFGRVATARQDAAIKGRVFFEDCILTNSGEWRSQEVVPQLLSSPKVTAYQHYVTQDGTSGPKQHTTYIGGDKTTIRGHKVYWHRWDETRGLEQVKHPEHDEKLADISSPRPTDRQTTLIQPIATRDAAGDRRTVFTGRVRFENLSDIELGALLCALKLPPECAHKIGMAKPHGLGSIRITPTLQLIDRNLRYSKWSSSGASTSSPDSFMTAFTEAVQQHAASSGEPILSNQTGLRKLARLDALFQMLTWEGRPKREGTQYLPTPADFRPRKILPTPHAIRIPTGVEPPWAGPVPTPDADAGGGSVPEKPEPQGLASFVAAAAAPGSQVKQGEHRQKVQLERRLKGGRARVKLETGEIIECVGVNPGSPIAPDNTFIANVLWVDGRLTSARYRQAE